MKIRFPYTTELGSDGKTFVQFVDFPEGVTEGETPDEIAANAQDVLDLVVAMYVDMGRELPKPSPVVGTKFSVATV